MTTKKHIDVNLNHISGLYLSEVISNLQKLQSELVEFNPTIEIGTYEEPYDDYQYGNLTLSYSRPLTEQELIAEDIREKIMLDKEKERDLEQLSRLKLKYKE